MDRHSHIPWQEEYCYLDLKSNTQKQETSKKMEGTDPGWLCRHQTLLQRFLSSSILVNVVCHMRKADLLSAQEAGLIQETGSLKDKVQLLVECLSVTDPHGASLQAYLQGSHLTEFNLITVHDSVVRPYKDALLQRLKEHENSSLQIADNSNSTLLLIECVSDLQQREHDLVQVSVNRGAGPLHGRALGLDQLITPLTRVSTTPRVTLTIGVAGSGKSQIVRRFIQLWSASQIYPELSLAIPIACWELSSFDRLSVERLLRLYVPYDNVDVIIFNESCKVLLILDGLEEFRQSLDFADAPPTSDPRREIPVSDLIANIVRGNLLPGATLWLLSKPGTGAKVPAGLLDRVTEAPPLSRTHIKNYINHCITNKLDVYSLSQESSPSQTNTTEDISSKVWTYLNSQKPLLILSSVPAVCHIIISTLLRLLKLESDATPLPRILTEVYAHYCWPHLSGSEAPSGGIRKPLGTLGRLAFYSLLRRRYTFSEAELRTYGVDVPLQGGTLGCRILQRRQSWLSDSIAWQFTHTSVQEFMGALFYYVSLRRGMFDLFSESAVSWPRIGFHSHYRAALQKTNQSDTAPQGNLDLFMRFLSGLMSPAASTLLGSSLGVGHEEQVTQRTTATTLLQNTVTGTAGDAVSMRSVTMVTCLAELQQGEWLRSVEDDLITCSLRGKLKGGVCAVLAYLLQVSDACTEETQLSNCLDSSSLKRLLPQLLYCSKLRMENNEFKEGTMELLGSLLSAKECHIQMLSLADNSISSKGIKPLSRALLVNRTLTTLDLRGNNIGAKGAKTLCEALKMNQVLVSVNLQNNHIEDEGARALAEVLQSNRKLTTLNIQKNGIGPEGVKKIGEALKKNQTLQDLNVSSNHLGDLGTVALAQALMVNDILRRLSLQSNSVSDRGIKALSHALQSNHGLSCLNLRENSIGVTGAKDIAKALKVNTCLRELDLTANLLHDEGVTAIAEAMRVNRAITSLHLQWNFIKTGAAKALAQSLKSNTCIQLLDLQENALGDSGVIALACALRSNSSLSVLYLQGVSAGKSGAVALADALVVNESLHTLDLRGNSIGMEGAKAFSSALKNNRSLRSLNLQENALGMDGAIFIATALRGNHQLTYINLQGNGIGESGAKVVSDAIKAGAPDCVVDI
ncbi:NLR family CARD domain-containing protein 3-like isoform X1 [Carassius carassius]|uniref:NLR family CARD domain-containing protein 3-like isoform X1 n=1 Tax=Carassius carassius TaxID=217509 RepID=UPI002868E3C6|nr:NLR family CARD domain-containing protein 3-like isoform X1 [Carassius carassius]XP_059391315.1 NLR family CARD domain-containing protein 3-like isoform X1 [Carassius carassius]XP_059391316.1 NLR family CARD domain-containing protein 3-like isoform X1 [Carassius carassius]